jgi:hypothetical protein
MTDHTITIDDSYVVPDAPLTKEQYINFVMNKAAESYKNSYATADFESGIQAACDAYNAAMAPAGEE